MDYIYKILKVNGGIAETPKNNGCKLGTNGWLIPFSAAQLYTALVYCTAIIII